MTVDPALVAAVEAAIQQRNPKRLPGGELAFTCWAPERHEHGDRHASRRWNPTKATHFCDVCGDGGGVRDLARHLGLELTNGRRASRETARWTLRDVTGSYVAEHIRVEPGRSGMSKDCLWFRHETPGLGGLKVTELPLYGVDELGCALAGSPVVVVEGEKARDALARRGIVTVATVTGAGGTPADAVLQVLAGRQAVLWPDADLPGRTHMRRIAQRLTALGIPCRWFDPWPERHDGSDAADWTGTDEELRAALVKADTDEAEAGRGDRGDGPWVRAVTAAEFLAGDDPALDWLVPRLLSPGSLTYFFSPRGLGKTHVAYAYAVVLARAGSNVLLLDRDNSRQEIRRRLRAWGAADLTTLHVMTRDDVPPLTDAAAWRTFPFDRFALVIVDSLDASTEGVGEQDSAKPAKAIAPLLDIAHRADGPALLALANTIKSGSHGRGSGVVEDRGDIVYEVRDATDFTPSGTKPWFTELPAAGRDAWAERATRRQGRDRYRLAFVPSKFRVGEEPPPFALEIDLSETPWQLRDVTDEIDQAGQAARAEAAAGKAKAEQAVVDTLVAEVSRRVEAKEIPLISSQAVFLLKRAGAPRDRARVLLDEHDGRSWRQVKDTTQKGHPTFVVGVNQDWPPEKKREPEICASRDADAALFSGPCAAKAGDKADAETVGREGTPRKGSSPAPSPERLPVDTREPGSDDDDPTPVWTGATVDDVREIFPNGRLITSTDGEPSAAGRALFEAARGSGFPWLRLRQGVAVGRGEDAWRVFVATASPQELGAARRALSRGEGIA